MKHLKHINEDFQKINENLLFKLFKNEEKLKAKLLENKSFANGEVSEAITDIIYDKWQSENGLSYNDILDWTSNEYGLIPYFTMMFRIYDGQVCNGGHMQYYENGYASVDSRGFGHSYKNVEQHDDFVYTFKNLDLKEILPDGDKMYDIIESFSLDLEPETEECGNCNGDGWSSCDECGGEGHVKCDSCNGSGEDEEGNECSECDGDGVVDCDECNGRGDIRCDECDGTGQYETGEEIPDSSYWSTLDTKWYQINENIERQYDDYLKTLSLDGEIIEDLIELSNSTHKYNV